MHCCGCSFSWDCPYWKSPYLRCLIGVWNEDIRHKNKKVVDNTHIFNRLPTRLMIRILSFIDAKSSQNAKCKQCSQKLNRATIILSLTHVYLIQKCFSSWVSKITTAFIFLLSFHANYTCSEVALMYVH